MKILFTQESDWLARNMHQQHHLAELMSPRGHEVRVIDYEIMHGWKPYLKRKVFPDVSKIYLGAKVTVVRPGIVGIPGLDYLSLLVTHSQELRRQLREFKPDVIVGFGILNSYLAQRIAKNVPFVYYWIDVLHGLIPFAPLRFVGKDVERMTLRKADKVLTINQSLRDYVCHLGAPRDETEVLGAGVDFRLFDASISGKVIRSHYGFRDDDIVLFYIGWLYKFSGLAEVLTRLAETGNSHIKLLVAGDGDAYNSLVKLRGTLQAKHKTFLHTYLLGRLPYDQIPDYIAASDVCILPAIPEEKVMQHIVPIKVYEYLAMGKPVVSTRLLGVVREFGYRSGVVYVDRPGDIVDRAVSVVREKGLLSPSQQVRKVVQSWDGIVDKFEEILVKIVKEGRNG